MLLILIQYLYYSFLSQFIHMSHTSSHHGLECPCLLSFFLQMSNTSRISTQNTHERLFSNDIHIKLAWTCGWFTEFSLYATFHIMWYLYNEHHFYIQPDVDVQIFKSSFKITMITYSNEKKNLQHHYPYPNNVNMKVYIHFV